MPTIEQALRYLQTLFPGQLVLYPPQLAQVIGRSEKALKHLIDRGTLPFEGKRLGNRWCVDVFRLAEWLALDSADKAPSQEKPTNPAEKPTRARRSTTSGRQGLGSKLLEMRQAAATAMRRMLPASGEDVAVVEDFVRALLQPIPDDHLELEAEIMGIAGDKVFTESYATLAAAVERVLDLRQSGVGRLRVTRDAEVVYECSTPADSIDWRVDIERDARFSAMLGLIDHQTLARLDSGLATAAVPAGWLAQQSLAVRREIQNLCAFDVDAGFFQALAAKVPVIAEAEFVSLYHDAWACLPSKRVFEHAVSHRWTVDALTQCINDAEVALSTPEAVADFEAFFPADEADLSAAMNWLREHAYRAQL